MTICRPQFFFRTADVTGTCTLPEAVEMVSASSQFAQFMHHFMHLKFHSSWDEILLLNTKLMLTVNVFVSQVVPGDNATLTIDLIYPVPMADGLRFALREGGKTVGAGVVVKVIE